MTFMFKLFENFITTKWEDTHHRQDKEKESCKANEKRLCH